VIRLLLERVIRFEREKIRVLSAAFSSGIENAGKFSKRQCPRVECTTARFTARYKKGTIALDFFKLLYFQEGKQAMWQS
jgi:hypothetical protein